MRWLRFDAAGRLESIVGVETDDPDSLLAPEGEEGFRVVRMPDDLERRLGGPAGELLGVSRIEGDDLVVDDARALRDAAVARERQAVAATEIQVAGQIGVLDWIAAGRPLLEEQASYRSTLLDRWRELAERRRLIGHADMAEWVQMIAGHRFRLR